MKLLFFLLKSYAYYNLLKKKKVLKAKDILRIKFWPMSAAEATSSPLKLEWFSHSIQLSGGNSLASDLIMQCFHSSARNHKTELCAAAACTISRHGTI